MAEKRDERPVQSKQERAKSMRDRNIKKAEAPNARLVLCNTPETYMISEMSLMIDISLNRFRDRIGVSITGADAQTILGEFFKAMSALETSTRKISVMTGVRGYRTPRGMNEVRKMYNLESDIVEEEDPASGTTGTDDKITNLAEKKKAVGK